MAVDARGLSGGAYASAKAKALREARDYRKPELPKQPAKPLGDMTQEEADAKYAKPKRAAEMSEVEYNAARANILRRGGRR